MYGRFHHEKGRPGLSTRLVAGVHLLKHMEGLSDEAVCARWVEHPYHQFFCGEQYFRHKLPLDRSSMTRWRDRIGADKLELLLAETLRVAMAINAVMPQACERVTLDTTEQTKAVAHPTDSHLLIRASLAASATTTTLGYARATRLWIQAPSAVGLSAKCRIAARAPWMSWVHR